MKNQISAISSKEKAALSVATSVASVLINEHPGIGSDYQSGSTVMQIAKYCGLLEVHTTDVARTAVRMALKDLLSEGELRQVFEDTLTEKRARGGRATFEHGVAVFGLDEQARKERAANSLETQVREKIGIHGFTEEQRADVRRKAIKALGMTPWTGTPDPETGLEELEYALRLMEDNRFMHQEGKYRNKPDYKKIAAKLNEVFHKGVEVRTALKICRLRERKGMEMKMPKKHPSWKECIHPTAQLNEKDYLALITNVPSFQRANGRSDYAKIAEHLNDLFHEGEEVRTESSVRSKVSRIRLKKD